MYLFKTSGPPALCGEEASYYTCDVVWYPRVVSSEVCGIAQ